MAYKNAVGSRRAAWRIITSIEQKEKSKGNEEQAKYANEYCKKVGGELQKICDGIIALLERVFIPYASKSRQKGVGYIKISSKRCRIHQDVIKIMTDTLLKSLKEATCSNNTHICGVF